jgi:hypothetical protein
MRRSIHSSSKGRKRSVADAVAGCNENGVPFLINRAELIKKGTTIL